MKDSGIVEICTVIEKHIDGQMPTKQLRPFEQYYFEDRVVGYGRQYAAMGVSQQVDRLILTVSTRFSTCWTSTI